MAGFFDHEAAIIARLRDQTDAHIITLRDIDDIRTYRGPTPVLAVGYDSGGVDSERTSGRNAQITQYWLVAALVRNVAGDSDESARSSIAGVVDAALSALMGFRYSDVGHLLTLSRLDPAIYAAGYLMVPLVFETQQRIAQPMTN